MPIERLEPFGQDYYLLSFDKKGVESAGDEDAAQGSFAERILQDAGASRPTHVFFFSHGWKGDMPAARQQYNDWIGAMLRQQDDRARFGADFRPLFIGLHWPSLPFGDESLGDSFSSNGGAVSASGPEAMLADALDKLDVGPNAEDALRRIVMAHWEDAAATGLSPSVEAAYRELAQMAGYRGGSEDGAGGRAPDEDGEPFDPKERFEAARAMEASVMEAGADFGGSKVFSGLLSPLQQMSYWTMKKRARSIGEGGMHSFVARLMQALPASRFCLMGHSFGCIVVSSILGGQNGQGALPRPVDSAVLVQGAVSLWSWAQTLPGGSGSGYFYPVLQRKGVKGPVVTTHSIHDRAVGYLYPLASRLGFAGTDFRAEYPKIGAIGSHGIQGSGVGENLSMLPAHAAYGFQPGRVYNLESSAYVDEGGGMSGAHSDISGPEVAHAIWQAAEAGGKL